MSKEGFGGTTCPVLRILATKVAPETLLIGSCVFENHNQWDTFRGNWTRATKAIVERGDGEFAEDAFLYLVHLPIAAGAVSIRTRRLEPAEQLGEGGGGGGANE